MYKQKLIDKQEIVNRLGLQKQSTEVQTQIIDKFLTVLNGRVAQTLTESLTPEKATEFSKLLEKYGAESPELSAWVNDNVPGQVRVVKEEYALLLKQMSEDMEAVLTDKS